MGGDSVGVTGGGNGSKVTGMTISDEQTRGKRRRRTREEAREAMRHTANATRDTADEMARMYDGCDDPLHPFMPVGTRFGQPFRDWIDFVERVARPLVEADGNDHATEQAAMALYRKASPHFICACLVMAANRAASCTVPAPEGGG